jgi:hypothetical protein
MVRPDEPLLRTAKLYAAVRGPGRTRLIEDALREALGAGGSEHSAGGR